MKKFILRRLGYAIFSLFIITSLSFYIISLKPGDPIAAKVNQLPDSSKAVLEERYGLNDPLYMRYFSYMKGLLTEGNLGDSIIYDGRNVNMLLGTAAIVSAKIGGLAILIQVVIGVILGMFCGVAHGKIGDRIITVLVVLAICVPSFVFCALLQYYVAYKWKLAPIMGWGGLKYYILPVAAYAIPGIATYSKYMRNSTIQVLSEDYIETARAKGCSRNRLIFKHVFRNAILPIVTMVPVAIGSIFGGAMVIEKFFSIPGFGQHYVKACSDTDSYMILGMTVFFAFTYIVSLFVVDILYGFVDPRIRISE